MSVDLKNVAKKPKQMVAIVLSVAECDAAGIACEVRTLSVYETDAGGNKRPKLITKRIPEANRWLPGEKKTVHDSILTNPKVQRAIAQQRLRQSQSEVVSKSEPLREAKPKKSKDSKKARA